MNREETIKAGEELECAVDKYLENLESITSNLAGIGEAFKSILEIIHHNDLLAPSEEKKIVKNLKPKHK